MSDPTVATALKETAVRSLVDRAAERLNLVRFFRYNASAKHGVPIDYETETSARISSGSTAHQRPAETQTVQQTTTEAQKQQDAKLGKGILAGLALATAIGGAGYLGYRAAKPAETTVSKPATAVEQKLPYESPLQWLEDQGEHQP